MKKISMLLIVSSLFVSVANAQAFEEGNNVIGIGVGIGGHYNAYGSYTSQTPAIGLSYEKATSIDVGDGVLGLGAFIGYKSLTSKETYYFVTSNYYYEYQWTYTIIGFRGAYHYDLFKVDKLDTYGGAMLSYNIVSFKDKSTYPDGYLFRNESKGSGVGFTLYVGGRYYFSEKFGAFAELGYGISYLTLGAAIKF